MENQRVRLSKKLLKNALIRLLCEKPIGKITVYELCEAAEINRTTFYKYYGSQYELLAEIEDEFFVELEKLFAENDPNDAANLTKVLQRLEDERDICRVLINTMPDQEFSTKLFNLPAIKTQLNDHTPGRYTPSQSEYIHLFFCQGGYAIIRKWLNSENPETPEEIARLVSSLGVMLNRI